jgi:gliding motility-associated-like protein
VKNAYSIACFLVLTICVLFSPQAEAAHLIGGEISYTCVGPNVYNIKLRIYRDCGGGGAQFDNIARVAVYDISNNLVNTLQANLGPIITVSTAFTGNPCVSAPPTLCSEYTDYEYNNISLPPIPGGYTLVHQRCCRNSTITNVAGSGSIGNTYSVTIPSNDVGCNSSPQIADVPPVVVCMGVPSTIPISAVDPDGDSLYYEFCEIYVGGGSGGGGGSPCGGTIPNPPCPPPFTPVSFIAPYTSLTPLPGNPQFTIDPITGTLTGTAQQVGQYVVGICVSDFRNGNFISQVRLDYQFNFTNCISNVVSDIVTAVEDPTIGCDGYTIDFTNQSKGATSYFWDFGDLSTDADTSRLTNPSYTYPGPGSYTVMIIAEPNLACADTLITTFQIKPPIDPSFFISGIQCFEGQDMDFIPQGSYPADATFEWDFGAGAQPPASLRKYPEGIKWDTPGKHYINLKVTANGCEYFLLDSVQVDAYTVFAFAGNDTTVNRHDEALLTGLGGVRYRWSASEAVKFSSPESRRTSVEFVNGDTIAFYLLVTDHNGCQGADTVLVFIAPGEAEKPINLFSPNGDGLNETFDLNVINPTADCELTVLNRWGSTVYFAQTYDNSWTGLDMNGNPLPEGTYYYILRCGRDIVAKDAVTILRNQ